MVISYGDSVCRMRGSGNELWGFGGVHLAGVDDIFSVAAHHDELAVTVVLQGL